MDTQEKLSPITLILHWSVALFMVALLAVGFYMGEFEAYGLYPIHKALGVVALVFVLARVIWRLKNGWPIPVRPLSRIEHRISVLMHWLLIMGTLLMPISGFLFSAFGGYGVEVFGWHLVPRNPNPENATEVIAFNAGISDAAHEAHEVGGVLLVLLIVLHMAAALKHHVIDKDRTLLRMKGR